MSIVNYLPELPKEGSVVYADNGEYPNDRATFKNGEFIGGGEFPVKSYKMSNVTKWFYFDEYSDIQVSQGKTAFSVSFEEAENMVSVADKHKRKFWYVLTYVDLKDSFLRFGSVYTGLNDKNINKKIIDEKKSVAGVSNDAVLINLSFLGFMTEIELRGVENEL